MNRTEWLRQRRKGIGASEVAALFDCHPFHSRYSLWVEKTSESEVNAEEATDEQERGLVLEPYLAKRYQKETGRTVVAPEPLAIYKHEGSPLFATPDRFALTTANLVEPDRVVELKSWMRFREDDEVSAYAQIQVQIQMLCTGLSLGSFAIEGAFHKFFFADTERNEEFIQLAIQKAIEFWRLVETRTPPSLEGDGNPTATMAAIRALNPKDSGETVDLPPAAEKWSALLPRLDEAISRLALKREAIRNYIAEQIGPATQGRLSTGDGWTFKHQKRGAYVVGETEFRVLRRTKKVLKELPGKKKEITDGK